MPSASSDDAIREALLRTLFADRDEAWSRSPSGRQSLIEHVSLRYQQCLQILMPWLEKHGSLAGAEVVEIGCGSGSSTAAFAGRVGHVHAYDINARAIDAARERLRILGLANATFHHVKPHETALQVERNHAGVDLVVLYAVLEHQTVPERLATLRAGWEVLRPGGLLLVTDTPNRLCYRHFHTSDLPFFDMLPMELALPLTERSPRAEFREGMRAALRISQERATEVLARWGTGVSHHEFEAVLGDLGPLVVGDGWEPEILAHRPMRLEEELLLAYFVRAGLDVPLGFARVSLDLLLRKPDTGADAARSPGAEEAAARLRAIHERLRAAALAPGALAGDGPPLPLEAAAALADRSLNGRTLVRLAARKLGRKVGASLRLRRAGDGPV